MPTGQSPQPALTTLALLTCVQGLLGKVLDLMLLPFPARTPRLARASAKKRSILLASSNFPPQRLKHVPASGSAVNAWGLP